MPLREVSAQGYLPDGGATIEMTLRLDPENMRVTSQRDGGWQRVWIMPTQASVDVRGHGGLFQGGRARILHVFGWIGCGRWVSPIPMVPEANGWVTLAMPLSDDAIEAIEDERTGQAPRFSITIGGLVGVTSTTYHIVSNTGNSPQRGPNTIWHPTELVSVSSGGFPGLGTGTVFDVPREVWLRLLDQAGKIRFLVELPAPDLSGATPSTWSQVVQHVRNADGLLRQGLPEKALEEIRKIVEGIATVLADQWQVPVPSDGYAKFAKEIAGRLKKKLPKEDAGQADSLGALLEAAWNWSKPSHHYGTGLPAREEAATALHLATLLARLSAQLLETYPDSLTGAP